MKFRSDYNNFSFVRQLVKVFNIQHQKATT